MMFKKNIFLYGVCWVTAVLIAVSLFTWSEYDATWAHASSMQTQIHNALGSWGANFAAVLLYLWGVSAYFFISFLLFLGLFFLKKKKLRHEWDTVVGWLLLIITGSTTTALYHVSFFPHYSAGGRVGQVIAYGLTKHLGIFLAKFFMAICIFISISLISRFSFLYCADYLIKLFNCVFHKERVLKPIAHGLACCARYIVYSMQRMVSRFFAFIESLLSGSFAHDQDSSIVTFEFDELVEEALRHTEDNTFWQPELQKVPEQDTPPKGVGTEEKETQLYGTGVKEEIVVEKKPAYTLPYAKLFNRSTEKLVSDEELHEEKKLAHVLEEKLARFGIAGRVVSIKSGPVITLFEYQPDIDAKISKIVALEDDLALALQAVSIRIIAPIPGKSVVGFEVAKKRRRNVFFSSIVHAADFQDFKGKLPLVFGQDTIGNNVVVDLASMPHLLVAGSTGSGKSVALNTMLMSLLYRKRPDELKLILIDPKRLEFAAYADIAHLIFPIITDPKDAAPVLQWVVRTMEERYAMMARRGVRNIFDYENLCKQDKELEHMPYIVVMIDELSDLMMTSAKETEGLIARIAQMARAAGIHMILATQRPSVDVITGLIKVNFPSRISFRVTSKVDSRTILDCVGAEKLLGKGDMLFLDSSSSSLRRVHGAYVSDTEIANLVHYIRAQQKPQYLEIKQVSDSNNGTLLEGDDRLYQEIVHFVKTIDEISISLLQRRFRIGYNRSARIIEMLETEGHILPSDGSKMRKVIR